MALCAACERCAASLVRRSLPSFLTCAPVDLPIDADTGAHVRHACRRLCTMRAEAAAHGPEHLAWLNILIAASELVGRFRSDAES